MDQYLAHYDRENNRIQTVQEHCEGTAKRCGQYGDTLWHSVLVLLGLFHDIGKYQPSFQKRIRGASLSVEHSICGALAVEQLPLPYALRLMLEYCIAGHHTGLPNGGFPSDSPDQATLYGRKKRAFEPFDRYKNELVPPAIDGEQWIQEIQKDCRTMPEIIDKFAFLTRYAFSCLVDADSLDTAEFYRTDEQPGPITGSFRKALEKVDRKLASFPSRTRLQKARTSLQEQAFRNLGLEGDFYLLSMPTGSGKTLASVKLALEQAIRTGKERIIYVIPYNSIIEQTADLFQSLFGDDLPVLHHQSTVVYGEEEEDYRIALENWDAPFLITTAVQFFETVSSNRRGKLRKLHHMANAILVFDEVHLMPLDYLQPCLQSIAYLTRYLHSQAFFLTATMPDFSALLKQYALPESRVIDLVPDQSLFPLFQTCSYQDAGSLTDQDLLSKSREFPSALVIVNRKQTARELYQNSRGKKYHLSTYLAPCDRRRILKEIRQELLHLKQDYPDLRKVPEDRRITIFSTSLIEAGVDLDVSTVFRERTGLDSILQAGGRCNREGEQPFGVTLVFDRADGESDRSGSIASNLAGKLLKQGFALSDPACIRDYYRRLFAAQKERIGQYAMHQMCTSLDSIPFQTYGEQFRLIQSWNCSVIIPTDETCRARIRQLQQGIGTEREFREYACSISQTELEALQASHKVCDFGTGIFCLMDLADYDRNLGIRTEGIK